MLFQQQEQMSAFGKVNMSGLSAEEKKALKALIDQKPTIGELIAEDSTVDDDLLRAYLSGSGKKYHSYSL